MSQENVGFVQAVATLLKTPEGIALLANGDQDFSAVDPNIEWDSSRLVEMIPDLAEVYRGHDGVRTFWRRWLDAWQDLEFQVGGLRDAGDEVVLLIRDQWQTGRHSGIVTELPPYAMVFTMRSGKLVRWRAFPDHESALKAVGLEE